MCGDQSGQEVQSTNKTGCIKLFAAALQISQAAPQGANAHPVMSPWRVGHAGHSTALQRRSEVLQTWQRVGTFSFVEPTWRFRISTPG
eukprot:365947-Chlamydomonas_euryale.AAC.6